MISFFKEFSSPFRMILDSLEIVKQRENEANKGAYARFEPGTLKSLQKFSFFPTQPLDSPPRVRREWQEKCFALLVCILSTSTRTTATKMSVYATLSHISAVKCIAFSRPQCGAMFGHRRHVRFGITYGWEAKQQTPEIVSAAVCLAFRLWTA